MYHAKEPTSHESLNAIFIQGGSLNWQSAQFQSFLSGYALLVGLFTDHREIYTCLMHIARRALASHGLADHRRMLHLLPWEMQQPRLQILPCLFISGGLSSSCP